MSQDRALMIASLAQILGQQPRRDRQAYRPVVPGSVLRKRFRFLAALQRKRP